MGEDKVQLYYQDEPIDVEPISGANFELGEEDKKEWNEQKGFAFTFSFTINDKAAVDNLKKLWKFTQKEVQTFFKAVEKGHTVSFFCEVGEEHTPIVVDCNRPSVLRSFLKETRHMRMKYSIHYAAYYYKRYLNKTTPKYNSPYNADWNYKCNEERNEEIAK